MKVQFKEREKYWGRNYFLSLETYTLVVTCSFEYVNHFIELCFNKFWWPVNTKSHEAIQIMFADQ